MTAHRAYRYYDLVMVAFVTVLVCSNLIGPAKIAQLDLPLLGTLTFAPACCSSRSPTCWRHPDEVYGTRARAASSGPASRRSRSRR